MLYLVVGGVPDGEHPAPAGDVHHQERPGLRQEPARDADTGTVVVVVLDGSTANLAHVCL